METQAPFKPVTQQEMLEKIAACKVCLASNTTPENKVKLGKWLEIMIACLNKMQAVHMKL